MKTAMKAIIRKDIRGITANRQLFVTILVVPLVLALVVPTIFMLTIRFAPAEMADMEPLLSLVPGIDAHTDMKEVMAELFFNHVLPIFFLIIPIMAASVMAAASFVGEKEQHTLETLLYGPLTVRQIFYAKVLASFLFSMLVSWLAFGAMLVVLETESMLLSRTAMMPGAGWLAVMLLVSPVVSLIAITLIVRGSARAQNMMEAQQKAAFLVLPVVLLLVEQFAGVMLINVWMLAGLGLVLIVPAAILLKMSLGNFTCEKLLI